MLLDKGMNTVLPPTVYFLSKLTLTFWYCKQKTRNLGLK